MFTNHTFNALTVLRAMLKGYAVEILGDRYAYDEETRRVGVLRKEGADEFLVYADIDLNRFLSMCEQVDEDKIHEMLAVLNHDPEELRPAPDVVRGERFH
ncbi:hypothetical protein NNJEOMEG_01837 [Fundidesulfovibrio magnetotacticus]|uniref:Uncharacterized protein n=1 Tax=Fundidesulfovibrio magnetotacticus TaxID=2730080 RepID=A0A6V8LV65_9BACT|nr:hypothetical protein [Fundidesulfovibrio magnetotacticus]GFK93999.1 hypothetical protein NNJEOMEG_01837 [Fundidesulfovibrio magnetotacticus]